MSFRERVENSPVVVIGGVAVAAFVAGVSTVTFIEAREDALREEIIEQLKSENADLEESRDEMEEFVKVVVTDYLSERAVRLDTGEIVQGEPLGGENSEVRENIIQQLGDAEAGEISQIIRDPTSELRNLLGL